MRKFTKPVKDRISEKLRDDRIKIVDVELENAIVEAFLGERDWPRVWLNMTFDPANELTDTMKLLNYIWPDAKWNLQCEVPGKVYVAWVEDETYSVYSFSPERALILAMWNIWNIQNDE